MPCVLCVSNKNKNKKVYQKCLFRISYRIDYHILLYVSVCVNWPTSWIDWSLAGLYSSFLQFQVSPKSSSWIALKLEDLELELFDF